MLHAESDEGRERAVVLGDGAFHLDLAEGDEQALLELGVEAEQPGGLPEVAAGRGERVHGGGTPTTATGKEEGREGVRAKMRGADRNARDRGQKGQGWGREKGGFFCPEIEGARASSAGLWFFGAKGY